MSLGQRRQVVARQAGVAVAVAGLCAKALALLVVPPTDWAALARLPCEDVAVGALLALALWRAPRFVSRVLGALLLGYLALNVVLVRALGTPLTAAMLRGVDGAMADCAGPYFAPSCWLPAVGAAAVGLWAGHRAARWRPSARGLAVLGGGAVLAALLLPPAGHAAHRHPFVAFVRSVLPRGLPPQPSKESAPPAGAAAAPTSPLLSLAGAARGRSVVVVVLESAAARFVGPGAPVPSPMPYFDELAAAGLCCTEAHAVYPESIEGQVAIFCGLPPIPDGDVRDYGAHAETSLPRTLRLHGYRSGLFHAGRFRFLGMQQVLVPFGFDALADAAVIGGDEESSFGIDEASTVDALLRWVDAGPRDQPFLACYLPIAGHHPYASPPGGPFPNDTQLGCYKNALHHADTALRRLWLGLNQRRRPDELLLCVVGDHGQAFGEHAGNFGHSFELYDENLRVPLCFVAPGTALLGRTTAAVCSHLAVVPTLLDLLGLPLPRHLPGPSLLRVPIHGGRYEAFTDWGDLLLAARDGEWKLVHDVATGRDRLFRLGSDPGERHDLVTAHAEVARSLRARAIGFAHAARQPPGR